MEKLTLKELAPYLPFSLMVLNLHTNLTYQLTDRVIDRVANLNESHKPILRNLSGLTKEIEHDGEKFVPIEKLRLSTQDRMLLMAWGSESVKLTYNQSKKLIEWKFDIFGLLDKNLAVPVTENFNPYK